MKHLLFVVLALGVLSGGCGSPDETQWIRIPLTGPQALDPSLIDRVDVAAVQGSSKTCVTTPGSNSCSGYAAVAAAEQADGFVEKISLRQSDGSTASFADLPREQTCFVAEALSSQDQQLALGCADVELKLERHKIEIEID